ncbi:MAG: tRNA-dihydrouridine synthase [Planctomycetota bacterium]
MEASPLQIGPVTLESNLLLAPIAGWCDLAWRLTARSFGGVGLACTDLLSPQGLLCGSEASLDLAKSHPDDRPLCMQLYGSKPEILADGARWCADHGATVVDINMGCPVDKVTKKDGGSKLMCNIPGAIRLAEAVRHALPDHIPLTCKMRLGWDEAAYDADCAPTLACMLTEVGAELITVHGRTTEMRFKGQVRHDGIKRVVDAVGERTGGRVPVIGNGDVRTPEDVVRMRELTGCQGVMIGRGAFAMPWIFRDAWHLQVHGELPEPVPELDRLAGIEAYFERMRRYRSDQYAMHKIRQKISWLGKGINGSHCRALKEGVRKAETPGEVLDAIAAWRAGTEPDAAAERSGARAAVAGSGR